ncbi:MAG: hypothetical protein ACLT98_11705 [Eggerthellaceae bacterium]
MLLGFAPDAVHSSRGAARRVGAAPGLRVPRKPMEANAAIPAQPAARSKHDFNVRIGRARRASIVYGILDTAATGTSASPAASILIRSSRHRGGRRVPRVLRTPSKPNPSMLLNGCSAS